MDVKLLQTQGERQSALLDTLCRIVGKINIRWFSDAQMHHTLLAVDVRDEGTYEDDDEGKMERPGRNCLHLTLDDIENAQGGKGCPYQDKPPGTIIVDMGIIGAF